MDLNAGEILRQGVFVVIRLAGPILLLSMIVGVLVAIFQAVTQIHEYLETGRCSPLDGPDGAYNLFERELRANQIIAQLSQIVVRLDEIRQLQYEIVAAIQATNGLLAGISQDISSLESAVNVNTAAINDFNASVSYQLAHR